MIGKPVFLLNPQPLPGKTKLLRPRRLLPHLLRIFLLRIFLPNLLGCGAQAGGGMKRSGSSIANSKVFAPVHSYFFFSHFGVILVDGVRTFSYISLETTQDLSFLI